MFNKLKEVAPRQRFGTTSFSLYFFHKTGKLMVEGCRMRKWIITGVAVLAAVIVAGLIMVRPETQAKQLTSADTAKLWVLSDPHFIAPSLHDEASAFTDIKKSAAGKDMDYQPQTVAAFVRAAVKQRPTAVVITGDVTFNGALTSAKSLAKRLSPLKKAGVKLLILPGNHDIYDGWARAYQGKQQVKVAQISPNDWRDIWSESYHDAASEDTDSLSYRVNLNAHYQLLCLDSNIYPVQESNRAPNTGGELNPATLKWLAAQLKAGQVAHRQSIVFMHHNLYRHNQAVYQGFVLNNAAALTKLLDQYHVKVVFSGHIHAQDISHDPNGQSPITEIVSGSFATSPNGYGEVTLTPKRLTYQRRAVDLAPVLTATERKNPDLAQHQQYLKKLFEQDAEGMAFEALYEANVPAKKRDAAVDLFGELNWRFFTGHDNPTPQALAQLKTTSAYQTLHQNADLRGYVSTILSDHNVSKNQHITIKMD